VGDGLRDGLLAAGYVHGLFNARNFVAERYCKLLRSVAAIADLKVMEQLWTPSGYAVAGGLVVLGVASACFCAIGEKRQNGQRAVALCAPATALLLGVLLTDWLDFNNLWSKRLAAICALAVILTGIYFLINRAILRKRGAFFTTGRGISLRKRRRRWLALWALLPWLCAGAYFVWGNCHVEVRFT
jgi:hypothetical protein